MRYHKGDVVRIEVPVEQVSKFTDPPFRREVVEYLKSLGFKYVSLDLEGFRSGSMNAVLTPLESSTGVPSYGTASGWQHLTVRRDRAPNVCWHGSKLTAR